MKALDLLRKLISCLLARFKRLSPDERTAMCGWVDKEDLEKVRNK